MQILQYLSIKWLFSFSDCACIETEGLNIFYQTLLWRQLYPPQIRSSQRHLSPTSHKVLSTGFPTPIFHYYYCREPQSPEVEDERTASKVQAVHRFCQHGLLNLSADQVMDQIKLLTSIAHAPARADASCVIWYLFLKVAAESKEKTSFIFSLQWINLASFSRI